MSSTLSKARKKQIESTYGNFLGDWENFMRNVKSFSMKKSMQHYEKIEFFKACLLHNKLQKLSFNFDRKWFEIMLTECYWLTELQELHMSNCPKWDVDYIAFWKNLKQMKNLRSLSFDLDEYPGCEFVYPEIGKAFKENTSLWTVRFKLENIRDNQMNLYLVPEGISENDTLSTLYIENDSCLNEGFFESLSKVSGLSHFEYKTTMRKISPYKEKEFFGACDCLTKIIIVSHTKFVDSEPFDKMRKSIIMNPSIVDIELDLFIEQGGYTFIE
jgi:hypothetical protein